MFEKNKHIHLIGIKGVGMTALAVLLKKKGVVVTGSDSQEVFFTDEVLARYKIPVFPFSSENITGNIDTVITSGAYYFNKKAQNNHAEVKEVLSQNIPIYTYPEAVGELSKKYKVIAIAGSHGKSTTTAITGWLLDKANKKPTVIVGTKVKKWNSNSLIGSSKYLVIEADEYREAFLNYEPYGLIITNIDYDHPDYYLTEASYYNAFKKLINKTKKNGFVILNSDDENSKKIVKFAKKRVKKTYTYGFSPDADYRCLDLKNSQGRQTFYINKKNQSFKVSFRFPGDHYALNATGAIAVVNQLNLSISKSSDLLPSFPGTTRRFDIREKTPNYTLIDDYAHHPTEIQMTLKGLRHFYPDRKIVAVFQPHTYSRTKKLADEFASSFFQADLVGILPIYGSAREKQKGITSKQFYSLVEKEHGNTVYLEGFDKARVFLSEEKKDKNIIILMGAGDINNLAKDI
ncbi:MAG: UDP-N-acetylmuramate--L-alanine ligase [Candidatus Harrisonbacteria bacterium CG10_big_fil_rev_8_21_14_0_10_38_8]|uniref:UDP-N-acetylmuramate--L-alanine ligase n=1 Tax=Candidatus Harrisonbacteria bacterium CG10_big_fil_rev_8_21_14_0_10_38_8 TaxID=1974582 RepID=A0A2M6WKA0_9BACT|nr:MAG: UDP-N-acetylmuramate--L-alanine ligase [Candidatus Harrisonbacteria bacterium CG10_big_fil_rev_8_21_14_0_10_38_8]